MTVSTWTSTSARSWRPPSTGGGSGGWRTDNNRVYQGQWENFGLHRGLWFFNDANIRSVLSGRNITRVRLRITRYNGGGVSAGQVPTIRQHNYSTQPAGQPTMGAGNSGHGVSYAWGETKWLTLPATNWGNGFRDGTVRGVGLYITSNTPYMIFQPTATLEITHEATGPAPVSSLTTSMGTRVGFPSGTLEQVTAGLNTITARAMGTEIGFQPFVIESPEAITPSVSTLYPFTTQFGAPVMQVPGTIHVPTGLSVVQEELDVIVQWRDADNVNHYIIHSRSPVTGEVFDPYNFDTQIGNTSGTIFRHRAPGAGEREYQVFGILASLDMTVPPLPIRFRFGAGELQPLQGEVPDLGYPYGNFQMNATIGFPAPELEDIEVGDVPNVSPLNVGVTYSFSAPNLVHVGTQDQFWTDFENTSVGALPAGWTTRVGSGFSVQNVTLASGQVARMLVLVAPTGNTTRYLSWNVADNNTDVEILARCAFSAGSAEQNTIYARTAANPTDRSYHGLYYTETSGSTLVSIERNLNGWSRLGSVNKATLPTAGQLYMVRFRVNGNQQKLKIWGSGTPEPADWDVETTDGGITQAGFAGVGAWQGGKTYYFDWVGIGLRGAEAPSHAPGAPAQLSATMPTTFRFNAPDLEAVPVVGQAVTLNSFTISANSSGVPTANWNISTNQSVTFDPMVVALRNSAGANLDFGHQWATVNNTSQSFNATRAALPGGDYTAWIAYNRAGTWHDLAPERNFTVNVSTPTPPPPSGATRNPDLPSSYNITWRDEFDGNSINWNRWRPFGWSQSECQRGNFNTNGQLEWNQADNPNNAWITNNNTLRMRAIRQNVNQCGRTYNWTGAHLNTQPSLIFQRNIYLEARLRVEGSSSGIKPGFWPAFWTWQADGVNVQREIDIWEYWSGWSSGERYSVNTHGGNFGGFSSVIWWRDHGPTRAYDWNVYGCWIRENDIWVYLNNKRIATINRRLDVNSYIIINLAVERNNPPPSNVSDFWMDWDWVRAWRP